MSLADDLELLGAEPAFGDDMVAAFRAAEAAKAAPAAAKAAPAVPAASPPQDRPSAVEALASMDRPLPLYRAPIPSAVVRPDAFAPSRGASAAASAGKVAAVGAGAVLVVGLWVAPFVVGGLVLRWALRGSR